MIGLPVPLFYGSAMQLADDHQTASHASRRTNPRDWSTRRKLLVIGVVLVAAAAVATRGSTATFTASASRSHQITTGNPSLQLGAAGSAANRLGVDVSALVPAASAYRAFDITNVGDTTFTSYTLTTVATTHSLLDTDLTNGIQMKLESCSNAWTESGSSPNFSYTCSGTTTTLIPNRPIIQSNVPLPGLRSWAPNGVDHLLVTETLPSTADSAFQNANSAITYTFNAA